MTDTDRGSAGRIRTDVPHSARIWNYWLGGKDNYTVDRQVGEEFLAIYPGQADIARYSRAFLRRVVEHLVTERGIRQFLDVGTGLPTADNTHEVAQRCASDARIVYADNDPLVLVHARALLTSTPKGACSYLHADIREPDALVDQAARTLDLDKPVALLMLGVIGHVPDEDDPGRLVARLVDRLAPGSYVVINDGTDVHGEPEPADAPAADAPEAEELEEGASARAQAVAKYVAAGGTPYHLRTPDLLRGFLEGAGLELVPPGLAQTSQWRPHTADASAPTTDNYCGLARKP